MSEPTVETKQEIKDSPGKKSRTKLVSMKDVFVETTELGYVTATDSRTRTFFCQLTKFSNEELIDFNIKINSYCDSIYNDRIDNNNPTKGVPKKIHRGDVLCAKYSADNCWYRALVLTYDKTNRKCSLLFVDYGNIDLDYDHNELIEISPQELSCIERCPFGITCFIKNTEQFTSKKIKVLFDNLLSNYVMIKIRERQSSLQWLVELPENAYNSAFLVIYKSALENEDDTRNEDYPKEDRPNERKKHRSSSYVSSSGASSTSAKSEHEDVEINVEPEIKKKPPPRLVGPGRRAAN